MAVPCVRVPTAEGEPTRRELADRDVVSGDYEITERTGHLYIPVTDPGAVPDRYDVVEHDVPAREGQTMPADLVDFEPSYERLGDIVIVDEDDPGRAGQLADAIVSSSLPVETVLNRASPVEGELRVRDWEILAGSDTETAHREYGFEYRLDVAEVYFSPRLATERRRVTEQVTPNEHVFDMFAGVGPFAIPAAARGADVVGVDLNEAAVTYFRENAGRNGVEEQVTAIHADVRDVAADWAGWADRIVMNLPLGALDFLDTAVRLAGEECVLHYYDVQHEDDPFEPGESAIREAANGYEVSVETRRVVRSYAPHELNVVLDARLEK